LVRLLPVNSVVHGKNSVNPFVYSINRYSKHLFIVSKTTTAYLYTIDLYSLAYTL